MKQKISRPDRILAHVRWLQPPYVGRALYLIERDGKLGFTPATEDDRRFKVFVSASDPNWHEKTLGVLPK